MTHRGPARPAGRSPAAGTPSPRRTAQFPRLLTVVAVVAVLGTGCSDAPAGTGGAEAPVTGSAEPHDLMQERREFATCMRANGVDDFPDPGPDGSILYHGEPDQEVFASASARCDPGFGDRGRYPGNGG